VYPLKFCPKSIYPPAILATHLDFQQCASMIGKYVLTIIIGSFLIYVFLQNNLDAFWEGE
jgi:hypothetical protein